ncbi:collagen alpha-1(III) chain-like [Passer montanus]|uniref:collagen alpha-1(III) chain-like n=1 Tax=Passer montanus TaxID=9160 RepID=UPI00195F6775|nr:collagen alpha-1(III) chain-like [Passer montanus]
MRRRRGGGAAPAEACGVWLDTAELKRGPARPLGAPGPAPGRRHPQTHGQTHGQRTILSFLSPRPGQRDKENRSPPRIPALPGPEGAREEPPGLRGTAQAWPAPRGAPQLQEEPRGPGRACPGAGEGSCGE